MTRSKSNDVAQKKLITEPGKKITKAKEKDPGAPKRPPTAFFVFMDEFRKDFKENFPDNKSVAVVAKEGGAKWKAMSDSEKAPYVEKAATKKAEYGFALKLHKAEAKEKSASTSKSSSYSIAAESRKKPSVNPQTPIQGPHSQIQTRSKTRQKFIRGSERLVSELSRDVEETSTTRLRNLFPSESVVQTSVSEEVKLFAESVKVFCEKVEVFCEKVNSVCKNELD